MKNKFASESESGATETQVRKKTRGRERKPQVLIVTKLGTKADAKAERAARKAKLCAQ